MKIENILNDAEKNRMAKIADDPVAVEALRKVFLFPIYYQGVLQRGEDADENINFALHLALMRQEATNEQIGADLRALAEAIRLVDRGIIEVQGYKTVEILTKKQTNEAE